MWSLSVATWWLKQSSLMETSLSAHQECEYIMSDLDEENLFLYSNFVKLSGCFPFVRTGYSNYGVCKCKKVHSWPNWHPPSSMASLSLFSLADHSWNALDGMKIIVKTSGMENFWEKTTHMPLLKRSELSFSIYTGWNCFPHSGQSW